MADGLAFPPADSQSEYAFPQGTDDNDPDQAAQRNAQIQSSFDAQRFQRNIIQGVAKSLGAEGAQLARLRAQQAAKP